MKAHRQNLELVESGICKQVPKPQISGTFSALGYQQFYPIPCFIWSEIHKVLLSPPCFIWSEIHRDLLSQFSLLRVLDWKIASQGIK